MAEPSYQFWDSATSLLKHLNRLMSGETALRFDVSVSGGKILSVVEKPRER